MKANSNTAAERIVEENGRCAVAAELIVGQNGRCAVIAGSLRSQLLRKTVAAELSVKTVAAVATELIVGESDRCGAICLGKQSLQS